MGLPTFVLMNSQPAGAAWWPSVIIPAATGIFGVFVGGLIACVVQHWLWVKHKRVEVLGQLRGLCKAAPIGFFRGVESQAFVNAERQARKLASTRGQADSAAEHKYQADYWFRCRTQAALAADQIQQDLASCVALIAVLFKKKGLSTDEKPISTILHFVGLEVHPCCSPKPMEWRDNETKRLLKRAHETYGDPLEELVKLAEKQI